MDTQTRLRGGGCAASKPIKEVSFPAVTPEERALHQAAAENPDERPRLAKVYDDAESIWDAMRDGQAILVRASWLLKHAGYEEAEVDVMEDVQSDAGDPVTEEPTGNTAPGWVLRRAARPLPHRAQIEAEHPEAIMPLLPVEECEAGHAKLKEVVAGAKFESQFISFTDVTPIRVVARFLAGLCKRPAGRRFQRVLRACRSTEAGSSTLGLAEGVARVARRHLERTRDEARQEGVDVRLDTSSR